ncbi:MAG: InlB B-repeat-containing protein, partial [Paludibacteraceae bacterium]|nr:InlB B-repeat-containing protein [Paludibacteraceae bacterium]
TAQVAYGTTPTAPEVENYQTIDKVYTFLGWDKAVSAVNGDVTYTAQFTETAREYTVTWVVNGVESTAQVAYGTTPTAPEVENYQTIDKVYTFLGWDKAVSAVNGDITYTAQFSETAREYTVTWVIDGVGINKKVVYGEVPVEPEFEKTRQTVDKIYTFAGWDKEIVAVTGDATYTAIFNEEVRTYSITWVVEGVETSVEVAYGTLPEYGSIPSKESDVQFDYTFSGWSPELVAVVGDATYTAQFTQSPRLYDITFVVNTESRTLSLPYGTPLSSFVSQVLAVYGTQYMTVDSVYTFVGWSPELPQVVTESATYEAVYTQELRKYVITFLDENGEEIWSYEEGYGNMPYYGGQTPTKEEDDKYTYEFVGWNNKFEAVTGDQEYVALFEAIEKEDTGIEIIVTDGGIQCNTDFRIYDITGKEMTNYNGTLPRGTYIIRTESGMTKKVMLK